MKKLMLYAVGLLMITGTSAKAQTNDEQANITKVIEQLFLGMEKGDSAMVRASFTKNTTLATIYKNKNGEPAIHRENSLKDFLKAVGTPHEEPWYEEYWNMKIAIDGDFAAAWCDYALYVGNQFSHCGVDAFHLFKSKDGWKIFHLTDTRRKEPCVVPENIKKKHIAGSKKG